jgi:hypothetical protein
MSNAIGTYDTSTVNMGAMTGAYDATTSATANMGTMTGTTAAGTSTGTAAPVAAQTDICNI